MEIRYQIKTRNISQKYWFEREGNDFVLKAHNKPTNRYKGALKEAGMLFTESDTPLYEEFLDILKPLSSHGIFRQNWLDICNPTSKNMMSKFVLRLWKQLLIMLQFLEWLSIQNLQQKY